MPRLDGVAPEYPPVRSAAERASYTLSTCRAIASGKCLPVEEFASEVPDRYLHDVGWEPLTPDHRGPCTDVFRLGKVRQILTDVIAG